MTTICAVGIAVDAWKLAYSSTTAVPQSERWLDGDWRIYSRQYLADMLVTVVVYVELLCYAVTMETTCGQV